MKAFGAALLLTGLLTSGCATNTVRAAPAAEPVGPREPRTDAEREELSFLIGMTPHHAQAVDMAKLCLDRAHDEGLRSMCSDIIRVQSSEIELMRTWALDWYGTQLSLVESALYSHEGASGSHGILRDEQMHELSQRNGVEFDVAFATVMIEHHVGAVASAEGLLNISPHSEVRQLAANIVTAQQSEVEQMQAWHAEWSTIGP